MLGQTLEFGRSRVEPCFGGCQLNLSIANWISGQSSLRCHRHGLPFRHRLVAENAERASGDEMTLDVKQIVNGTVNREKPLR